ncbi:MAG: hypothetical protein IJQ58_05890 [Synergistaceae bacterium]|nr:hypothetical protein [Synergistaceae bacterium]
MLVEVAVPEMALNSLTYDSNTDIAAGTRVIVEVGRKLHAGFVWGRSKHELPPEITIKPIAGVIDESPVIDRDIWEMALWAGKVCMCGAGTALKALIPKSFYMGEKFIPPPENDSHHGKFNERNFFNPFDSERVNFFVSELSLSGRVLILFPTKEQAKSFFMNLPDTLKSESLLWPSTSPKLWEAWKAVRSRKFRIVIAPPGGVSAPLMPHKIIVEDESNPSYILPNLNISARSMAGYRARLQCAEFITAGRIPSLKTYKRTNPRESLRPERKHIIIADINASLREEIPGIKGDIPLTHSLINHTYNELAQNRNVIWILDRIGSASEVVCDNCGKPVTCRKCGGAMQSRNDGMLLTCRKCGSIRRMPDKCEHCGYDFLAGNRPGLESLAEIARKYCNSVHVYGEGVKASDMRGLVVSTHRGLVLCGKINLGLVAWLDFDAESFGHEHTAKYNAYSMLYESYWRGREMNPGRKVLIQAGGSGLRIAGFLARGWGQFIPDELEARREFMLPPFGYAIEIGNADAKTRDSLMDSFMREGIFVMDPGDDDMPLYVNTLTLEPIRKILEPLITIRKSLNIKVVSE